MKPGWKNVALQEVAEIERNIIDPSAISDGTTYVGLENIETGGLFVNVRNVTGGELASTKFAFTDKHVLYGKLRPYLAKIARPTFNGVCSTDILPILPNANLDRNYLTYFLRQPSMVELATSRSTGANLPRLSPKVLAEFSIPLPPIAEQKRIAAILDKAEELRGLRRKALGELDAIAQSTFLEMFGDPETNTKNWSIACLSDLVSEFRYGSSNKSELQGKPALRIPNVVGGTLDLSDLKLVPVDSAEFERLRLQNGDILFVRTNGNPDFVGRCAIFDYQLVANTGFPSDEFIYASYLIRARLHPKSIVPIFLREFLLGKCGRKELRSRCKTSAGQFNINIPSLSAIPIPMPPISLQQEFARRIEAIEQLKATHRESLAQLDALFATLQHRAFRGEL